LLQLQCQNISVFFYENEKVKAKKVQKEEERGYEVMTNNMILLRHLTEIASSKRVNDGNGNLNKVNNWLELNERSELRDIPLWGS
jgi:hypothetical protein